MTHWMPRRLRALRQSAKLTHRDVARRLGGIRWRRVLWWEIGMREMSLDEATAYASLFGYQLALQVAPREYESRVHGGQRGLLDTSRQVQLIPRAQLPVLPARGVHRSRERVMDDLAYRQSPALELERTILFGGER